MTDLERLQQMSLPFADLMGIAFTAASRDKVVAELPFATTSARGLPCCMAALSWRLRIRSAPQPPSSICPTACGRRRSNRRPTSLSSAPAGTKVTGETTPIHRGRQTMVWQTRVLRDDGRLVALVTQTQLVFEPKSKT